MGLRKLNLFDDFIIYKVFNIVKPKIMAIKLQKNAKICLTSQLLVFHLFTEVKIWDFFFF